MALAAGAMQQQAKAIGQGSISTMDPQWAGPALAEAWCYAPISLSNGNLDRSNATAIISAIEGFVADRRKADADVPIEVAPLGQSFRSFGCHRPSAGVPASGACGRSGHRVRSGF